MDVCIWAQEDENGKGNFFRECKIEREEIGLFYDFKPFSIQIVLTRFNSICHKFDLSHNIPSITKYYPIACLISRYILTLVCSPRVQTSCKFIAQPCFLLLATHEIKAGPVNLNIPGVARIFGKHQYHGIKHFYSRLLKKNWQC